MPGMQHSLRSLWSELLEAFMNASVTFLFSLRMETQLLARFHHVCHFLNSAFIKAKKDAQQPSRWKTEFISRESPVKTVSATFYPVTILHFFVSQNPGGSSSWQSEFASRYQIR